jgi:hypothetical protein
VLKTWLDEEHDFLADVARLRNPYGAWSNAKEHDKPRALLHGLLLSRARESLTQHPHRFAGESMEPIRAFILDSAAAEDAEQARMRHLRLRGGRWLWCSAYWFSANWPSLDG